METASIAKPIAANTKAKILSPLKNQTPAVVKNKTAANNDICLLDISDLFQPIKSRQLL